MTGHELASNPYLKVDHFHLAQTKHACSDGVNLMVQTAFKKAIG